MSMWELTLGSGWKINGLRLNHGFPPLDLWRNFIGGDPKKDIGIIGTMFKCNLDFLLILLLKLGLNLAKTLNLFQ
jgi:hypothetical protein